MIMRERKIKSIEDFETLFWSKVDIKHENICWPWTGTLSNKGYGFIRRDKKTYPVHRKAYELFFGDIDNNLFVCHKCDNRICCNPFHLHLGTAHDNSREMVQRKRTNKKSLYNATKKLSLTQVEEIRLLHSKKIMNGNSLAKLFGVSIALISMIINHKRHRS